MRIEEAKVKYGVGKPILREDLKPYIKTKSENTFNQMLSNLVKFDVLKRVENGIYYFPHEKEPFLKLGPSIRDIIHLKYLNDYSGIRTGAFLAYKYKLTSQVSGYYEIITNNISKSTRGKKEFDNGVIIKASKFKINKDNINYLEFLELINNMKYSDYGYNTTLKLLIDLYKKSNFNSKKMIELSKYYGGYVNKRKRDTLEVILNETA